MNRQPIRRRQAPPTTRGRRTGGSRPRARSAWLVAAATVLGLAASGCQDRASREEPAAAAPQTAVTGGVAVVALPSEPDVLNSLIYNSAISGHVVSLLQVTLAEMGEDLEWYPRIAAGWEVDADSLAITYRLRPWRWSDGEPLTARDVVRSFELIKDPAVGSPRAALFRDVVRATAPDAATVRYEFSRPVARPVERTAHALLPWHRVRELVPSEIMNWPLNQAPLASGPFRLERWEHNRQLVLVPNEHYPLPRPFLDRVVLRVIPDQTSRILALETGEVDFVDKVPAGAAERLRASGRFRIHEVGGRAFGFVLWNLQRSALAERPVRRALSLAIDRSRFVDGLLQGNAQPAASYLPPALWNHHADLAADPYDPAAAAELLAAAGWIDRDGDGWRDRDGVRLEIELLYRGGDPLRENGTVIVRENLKAVGVAVRPRAMEHTASIVRVRKGEFDAYLGEFSANLYADPSPLVHSQARDLSNFGGYANATVDSLLEVALGETDRARALPVWRRVQEELADDPPAAVLYYPVDLVAVDARLHGVRPHMLSPYNNLHEWWIPLAERRYRNSGS